VKNPSLNLVLTCFHGNSRAGLFYDWLVDEVTCRDVTVGEKEIHRSRANVTVTPKAATEPHFRQDADQSEDTDRKGDRAGYRHR